MARNVGVLASLAVSKPIVPPFHFDSDPAQDLESDPDAKFKFLGRTKIRIHTYCKFATQF